MSATHANTTPIYPHEIIKWRVKLTNEITARDITTETPILLGTAGENGAIIHSIEILPLGDNVASSVFFFTHKPDEVDSQNNNFYFLEIDQSIVAVAGATATAALTKTVVDLPQILPSPQKALHLSPGESLYVALGAAVTSGVIVKVVGGNY